jgi:D-amino-acid dehydrogenase
VRVAVIGAGIVGVTTAYELALQGHQVTVFERHSSVAAEGSFADAGLLSAGVVAPWRGKRLSMPASGGMLARLPWMWRAWRASRPAVYAANHGALADLAMLSRYRLQTLTADLKLDYEQAHGCLQLLRSAGELRAAESTLALWRPRGIAPVLLDPAAVRILEPGLNPETTLHAAVHWPQDGVGNCRQFAQLLRAEAQRLGARFAFQHTVRRLLPGAAPALELATGTREECDAVVVCAGAAATRLLRPLGLRIPLATAHSHSLTAPLRHVDGLPHTGPQAAVVDAQQQISITRLGQRLRVTGGGDFGATAAQPAEAAMKRLYRALDDWFPGAARQGQAQHWRGTRPTLPDGPPLLGASGAAGVWLNVGHGEHGWVLACGSAQVLAEQLAGRAAPLDVTRLGVERLRARA